MSKPLISVIVPVYNGEKFLVNTIKNIIAQDYNPLEIIIIDDGSTDSSLSVLNDINAELKILHQNNQGPAAARNKGISIAKGDYIAFLDCDDLWPANKLIEHADYLNRSDNVDLLQGLVKKIYLSSGNISFSAFPQLGNTLFRSNVFERIGAFDESMRYAEDTDWFFRAYENKLTKVIINKIALYYQIHANNMTKHKELTRRGFFHFLKRHLDRTRLLRIYQDMTSANLLEYLGAGASQLNAIKELENEKQ